MSIDKTQEQTQRTKQAKYTLRGLKECKGVDASVGYWDISEGLDPPVNVWRGHYNGVHTLTVSR